MKMTHSLYVGKWLKSCCVQGAMPEARWGQVHDQRLQVLQLGFDHQRRGCRGYSEGERERVEDWMDELEPQLGSELAVKCCLGWTVTLLQGHRQWPTHFHFLEHCPCKLAVWPNFHWKEFQSLIFNFPALLYNFVLGKRVRVVRLKTFFWLLVGVEEREKEEGKSEVVSSWGGWWSCSPQLWLLL